jgi:hypothetical protein
MPTLPATMMKFAMALRERQAPSRSPRLKWSRKIGMNTIDSAPAARR